MVNNSLQVVPMTNSADGNHVQAWEMYKPRQNSFQNFLSSISCLVLEIPWVPLYHSVTKVIELELQSPQVGDSAGHTVQGSYRPPEFKRDFWIRPLRRQAAHTKPLTNRFQGAAALFMTQNLHHPHVGSDSRQPKSLEMWSYMFRALTILTTTEGRGKNYLK